MSSQPFPFTWKTWIARTTAGASLREYVFVPAVWWTWAIRSSLATVGSSRRRASSASQPARETIAGAPAAAVARMGTSTAGLRTVSTLIRVT